MTVRVPACALLGVAACLAGCAAPRDQPEFAATAPLPKVHPELVAQTGTAASAAPQHATAASQILAFGYDAAGYLDRIEDETGSVAFTRDVEGRVLAKTESIKNSSSKSSNFRVSYAYSQGELTQLAYSSGLVLRYVRQSGQITGIELQEPAVNPDPDRRWEGCGCGPTRIAKAPVSFLHSIAYSQAGQPQSWIWWSGDTGPRGVSDAEALQPGARRSPGSDAGNGRPRASAAPREAVIPGQPGDLTNAQGQRVFKTDPSRSGNRRAGTAYVYGDGPIPAWALLGEYKIEHASVHGLTEYIWLPTPGGGAVLVGMYRRGQLFAVHTDHLGTPRLMTDSTNTVVWRWPFSAFGLTRATGIFAAQPNPNARNDGRPLVLTRAAAAAPNIGLPSQNFDADLEAFHTMQGDAVGAGLAGPGSPHFVGRTISLSQLLYAPGNSSRNADPGARGVYLCQQPAFGLPWDPIEHYWIKTDTVEAGMGPVREDCGNAGHASGDLPGDPVQICDHRARDKAGATCTLVRGVEEAKVNAQLVLGKFLGRWGPTNQCWSFTHDVLDNAATGPQPQPAGRLRHPESEEMNSANE